MAKGRKTGGRGIGTRNKVTAEIKAAFQLHGDELVAALLKLTKSDDERVRLGAIQAALDRGYGKPTQAVDLAVHEPITKIEHVIVNPLPGSELVRGVRDEPAEEAAPPSTGAGSGGDTAK